MSKHQKLLDWIESELSAQRLHLGDQLPDDRRLARLTGMSQNHVRESLKYCEAIGLLHLFEGKRKSILGQLLREPAVSAGSAIGLSLASSTSPRKDLLQTCLMLESYAVSTVPAAEAAYPELERLLERMSDPQISLSDFHDAEADYHVQLGQLSGNPLISALLATMRSAMIDARFSLVSQVPLWSSTAARLRAEYRAILDAVRSQDPALARALLVSNLTERFAEAEVPLHIDAAGSQSAQRSMSLTSVDLEERELVPGEWGGSVTPDLVDALQNIQPISTSAEITNESARPLDEQKEPTILRAGGARKRRGTVSPAVHALIIGSPTLVPSAEQAEEPHRKVGEGQQIETGGLPETGDLAESNVEQQPGQGLLERTQTAVKSRLVALAEKRRGGTPGQHIETETSKAPQEEPEPLSSEQDEAAALTLEEKFRAEEVRLAERARQHAAEATPSDAPEPPASTVAGSLKKRFDVMGYFGFRQQTQQSFTTQEMDSFEDEGSELLVPEGYEAADNKPEVKVEYIDEITPREPLESSLRSPAPRALSKKKKGKRKKG
ncbi:MAG: FCD domain-containing protein [Rothia sp. (in: high G+C Gram-positive bacteria)]|nr:FCD domain-containing protein [Rothia sp. (in: high G+C Gram-positive bacteria)]